MKKEIWTTFTILVLILCCLLFIQKDKLYKVVDVVSPVEIVFDGGNFKYSDLDCFDSEYTHKNKELAEKLNITETEAFILGNLGKYWAVNLLKGRYVYFIKGQDIVYLKRSYREKFNYSGYCLNDSKPCYDYGFNKKIEEIRRAKYVVFDIDNEKAYEPSDSLVRNLKHYILIRKYNVPKNVTVNYSVQRQGQTKAYVDMGKIKVFFTDSTLKLKPDRNCDSSVCREILTNINNAKETIDMAIYGYSRTPAIEKALIAAIERGVKVRLVYDMNPSGQNIYPNTDIITKIISDNKSDIGSIEANSIMHNKFYIFDNKILITGSANLSHTDMSGFNSNVIAVIESEEIAQMYKKEFEQMYGGRFHNAKSIYQNKRVNLSGTNVEVYFSPKDKGIGNAVIPLINNAKKYIYIPVFVLTDRKTTEALIRAKNRGVDVRMIIDALNASVQHSKHKELRQGGIPVKTENYAGKMHSKSMIIDDEYTIIGSMNFSNSGENKNDENMLVIQNPEITKAYKEFFLYQWNKIDDKWLKLNARAEGKDSIGSCTDGLDNNYDGLTDLDDPACKP